MPSRRIPSLRKHKASGQAVVTLGGRDHYCGPWGSRVAVAEYDRLVGEWLASGRPSHAPRRGGVSIAELILAYAKHCQDYYRPPSREWENIKYALRPLKERYAHVPAEFCGRDRRVSILMIEISRRRYMREGGGGKFEAFGEMVSIVQGVVRELLGRYRPTLHS